VFPLLALHGSRIAIIGAGDAAFDYALNLARNNAVTILHRSQTTDCLPLLRSRARACERIIVRSDVEVTRIEADSSGSGLRLGCLSKDGEDIIVCDHLIFAIGRQPQLDFIQPSQREQLEALAESRRLFFVGDVTNGQLRQTAIAVGDGLRAAMRIFAYIRSSGDA
jgi:thioredoxin reductase